MKEMTIFWVTSYCFDIILRDMKNEFNSTSKLGLPETEYIKWEKRFELGIYSIDQQHKRLLAMCNSLYATIMSVEGRTKSGWMPALQETIRDTADYALTHFKYEEALMEKAGYPDFVVHKKSHEKFVKEILERVKNFDKTSFHTAIQFVKFLYEWILSHIAYEDKNYVPYVSKIEK